MAQKRLASTLLTSGATSAVYTVPAGKSATVSVFARNVGSDSSTVSLSHSQLATAPVDNSAAKQLNTVNYTTTKNAPLGILNIGTPTVTLCVPSQVVTGGDPISYGPIAIYDESANTATIPYNTGWGPGQYTMSSSNYWYSRYQISGFYGENDYHTKNSNSYPRRIKGYPWDSLIDKSYQSNSYGGAGQATYGGYDGGPSYDGHGSAGFRTQQFHINSTGYLSRYYTMAASTGSNANNGNYTSTGNSPYWLGANVTTPEYYALSILPTSKLSSANLRLVVGTVTGNTHYIWSIRITDAASADTYTDQQVINKDYGSGYSSSWLWYRPVGDYVYAASTTKVFRAPITTWWTDHNAWTDVTSSFPSNLNFYMPFIEDKNGVGYTCTTNGDVLTCKDGVTWTKADSSTVTSGIGSLTNSFVGPKLNSYDQFAVYTSTGKYQTLSSLNAPTIKPDAFELDLALPSKSHLEHKGIILNAGDKVYARATNSDTIIDIYGFEE